MGYITIENILVTIFLISIGFKIIKDLISPSLLLVYWEIFLVLLFISFIVIINEATNFEFLQIKVFIGFLVFTIVLAIISLIVKWIKACKTEEGYEIQLKQLKEVIKSKTKSIQNSLLLNEYEITEKKDYAIILSNIINTVLQLLIGLLFIIGMMEAIVNRRLGDIMHDSNYISLLLLGIIITILIYIDIPKTVLHIRYKENINYETTEMSIFLDYAISMLDKGIELNEIIEYNCCKSAYLNHKLKQIKYDSTSDDELLFGILKMIKFRLDSQTLIRKMYLLIKKSSIDRERVKMFLIRLDEKARNYKQMQCPLGYDIISTFKYFNKER